MRAAVSWSGGKDSALALLHATSQSDLQVRYLLNMVNLHEGRKTAHGLDPRMIAAQAHAMGIAIVQRETTWEDYERNFKQAAAELKDEGVEAIVFGDMDIQEHKDWTDRVCAELGLRPLSPLWGAEPHRLMDDFIAAGFEAVVTAAKVEFFDAKWLGRKLDAEFVSELERLGRESGVHLCGEQGEYHTFVCNGPIFHKKVAYEVGEVAVRNGLHCCDLEPQG